MRSLKKGFFIQEALNSSLKLIIKTSFIVFFGLILSKILGYCYRILIARYFGPEIYGLFSLAFAIFLFFISISSLGLSEGLIRFIPQLKAKGNTEEIRYLIKGVTKLYLIFGVITSLILLCLSEFISIKIFHNPDLLTPLRIISLAIPFTLFLNIYLAIFRGFEQIGWYSFIYNIFQNIVRFLIMLMFIILGFSSGTNLVVWSFVIGFFITFLLSYFVCKHRLELAFYPTNKKEFPALKKEFFNYSWPILFYSIISGIFFWIDSFSLGFYKSAVEVGIYNTAVPIAMVIGFIPEVFMQLFFPMINRHYSEGNIEVIKELSKQVTKWIFMVGLPIFVLIFFFPGAALNILFGQEYLQAENALRILLIGAFISALFIVCNNLISMLGKSRLVLINLLLAAFLNFILNSVFIPMPSIFGIKNPLGLEGAAIATLISIIFLNLLFAIQTKKYLSFIPLRRKMIIICLIIIIPSAILFYVTDLFSLTIFSIFIVSGLFILLYLILLILSNSLDEKDWLIFKSIIKKMLYRKPVLP